MLKDDWTMSIGDLRDDYMRGEKKGEFFFNGDHLFLIRLRDIDKQRKAFDNFCKEYCRKNKNNINPLRMYADALEYVRDTCGNANYFKDPF